MARRTSSLLGLIALLMPTFAAAQPAGQAPQAPAAVPPAAAAPAAPPPGAPAAAPAAVPAAPAGPTAAPETAAPVPVAAPAEAPPPAPAAPAPAPLPVVETPAVPPPAPAADAAPPPDAPPPTKLSVGTEGWFQPGILLQGWFVVDHAAATVSTFRLRRAEFSVKGDIVPKRVSYALVIDPAMVLDPKDTTVTVANQTPAPTDPKDPKMVETVTVKQPPRALSALKEVFITFQSEYLDTSIGQFKIPMSWEGYNSSGKLLFAERAMISSAYGDKRDLGVRLAKTFKYFGYSAGLFNGAGLNNLDTNNGKDGALRLEAYPVEGLVIAAVGYSTLWNRKDVGTKDRWEIDARYENGPFLFQSEFIRGRDRGVGGSGVTAQGFYAALAYKLLEDRLQPAVRIGYFDPDAHQNLDPTKSKGADEVWHYDFGLNYYISKNEAKLQLNYYRQQYQDKKANNEVILAAQVMY
jgi:hypothetical protein